AVGGLGIGLFADVPGVRGQEHAVRVAEGVAERGDRVEAGAGAHVVGRVTDVVGEARPAAAAGVEALVEAGRDAVAGLVARIDQRAGDSARGAEVEVPRSLLTIIGALTVEAADPVERAGRVAAEIGALGRHAPNRKGGVDARAARRGRDRR